MVVGLDGFEALLGQSPALRAVVDQLREVAETDATLLLLGESGTGKELLARAVHRSSARRQGAFVPVNCAAIPEPLLESELFGHEKGAFTGAARRTPGLFAEAAGGTLFLDEIGDMPAALQAKLLRTLQDKSVRPVGGRQEIPVDLRLISATNRDLTALVRGGTFRADLYYRLAVIPIAVPSLRERADDIPLLAAHFAERAAAVLGKPFLGLSDQAQEWLLGHHWPGNVRELENMVQRAMTLATGPIELADLGTEFGAGPPEGGLHPTLAEVVDRYIRRVLHETRGDKRTAAKILAVSVRTLQRRTPSARSSFPRAS
jgi:transcriptional regulator with PAS, ATPase and Fis domain